MLCLDVYGNVDERVGSIRVLGSSGPGVAFNIPTQPLHRILGSTMKADRDAVISHLAEGTGVSLPANWNRIEFLPEGEGSSLAVSYCV